MTAAIRPRRSVIYVPGSNPRVIEKAKGLPVDGVILDLEDAVAPEAKVSARDIVAAVTKAGGFGTKELIVRVNGLNTDWGYEDLVAVAGMCVHAILIPKVDGPEAVRQADAILSQAGAPEALRLWCMMETPLGILNAKEIAAAGPRLGGFAMGTSDLAKDLHAAHTRERLPMLTSLGLCLLAARAYGLSILDGVHLDLNDPEGLVVSCRQGAEMGFDGKTLIHPSQIAAANHAFAPSEAEIDWARKVIAAHAAAAAEGKGITVLDGRLVENLHVQNAQRVVALAEAVAEAG